MKGGQPEENNVEFVDFWNTAHCTATRSYPTKRCADVVDTFAIDF